MKVLVAVPTFETITPETFRSIYNLKLGEHDVSFDFVKGYDCAKARNEIAKKTTEGGYDAVLMVDSDIIVPDTALLWMTEIPADIDPPPTEVGGGCFTFSHAGCQNKRTLPWK